jgi:polar amino acid transport system substrate-binding protein
MKRFITSLLLIVMLAGALAACSAQEPASHMEAIREAGVIKVGTSADYPPFEYVDDTGKMVGFDIELMEEIAKRMNLTVEWTDMPFDSLIAAVQEGKIDMSISAFNYTEERDQTVDFTDAYFTTEDSFMVADTFTGTIANPEDVAAYKVGVQTGTTQDDWLTTNLVDAGLLPEANLFRYDRVDQAALDLKNGRIDVLMADSVPAVAIAAQQGLVIAWTGILSSGPVNMVIPEGDAELASQLNTLIQQLRDQGVIDNLAIKYMGSQ